MNYRHNAAVSAATIEFREKLARLGGPYAANEQETADRERDRLKGIIAQASAAGSPIIDPAILAAANGQAAPVAAAPTPVTPELRRMIAEATARANANAGLAPAPATVTGIPARPDLEKMAAEERGSRGWVFDAKVDAALADAKARNLSAKDFEAVLEGLVVAAICGPDTSAHLNPNDPIDARVAQILASGDGDEDGEDEDSEDAVLARILAA